MSPGERTHHLGAVLVELYLAADADLPFPVGRLGIPGEEGEILHVDDEGEVPLPVRVEVEYISFSARWVRTIVPSTTISSPWWRWASSQGMTVPPIAGTGTIARRTVDSEPPGPRSTGRSRGTPGHGPSTRIRRPTALPATARSPRSPSEGPAFHPRFRESLVGEDVGPSAGGVHIDGCGVSRGDPTRFRHPPVLPESLPLPSGLSLGGEKRVFPGEGEPRVGAGHPGAEHLLVQQAPVRAGGGRRTATAGRTCRSPRRPFPSGRSFRGRGRRDGRRPRRRRTPFRGTGGSARGRRSR